MGMAGWRLSVSSPNNNKTTPLDYVLVTPARNEELFIEGTIQSVVNQTVAPLKWVIVSDGSTDRTAEIVASYAATYHWIEMIELPQRRDRSFAAKVHAFNAGLEKVRRLNYAVIGNLDADVSFASDYCEFLMDRFQEDENLGVAGTIFREEGYSSETDSFEGQNHVAGGCQFFRRECFKEVDGYTPNRAGGIDWIAVTTARMMGWKTRSFREHWFFHHRSLGTAERGRLKSAFSYGEKDFYLGGHPLWELCRIAYRMAKPPYILGGAALGLGYLSAFARRMERPVSEELLHFHRKEQMAKLRAILRSLVAFKRIDSFEVASS
jgi:glycosyltransferase involved in cell wall biosynthesis